jgi:OOP family OmpA-OmpF porin
MRGSTVLAAAMLSAVVLALPAVSMAQARGDTGWYVGASVGQSKARHVDCAGFDSCDSKAAAFGILGGYQISRNFAAELGYHDFGKVTFSAPGVSGNIKANAAELVGLGAYPFANRFSVYGKLGAYRAESKISPSLAAALGSGSLKDRNTDLTFGLGAQYDVAREAGVRAEWQRYKSVGGDDTGGKHDIEVISIGLIWRFH